MNKDEKRTETINIKPSIKSRLESYIQELLPYAIVGADDAVEKLATDLFNGGVGLIAQKHHQSQELRQVQSYLEEDVDNEPPQAKFLSKFVSIDGEDDGEDDDYTSIAPPRGKRLVDLSNINLKSR